MEAVPGLLQPLPKAQTVREDPGNHRSLSLQLHYLHQLIQRKLPDTVHKIHQMPSVRVLAPKEVHLQHPVVRAPGPVAGNRVV